MDPARRIERGGGAVTRRSHRTGQRIVTSGFRNRQAMQGAVSGAGLGRTSSDRGASRGRNAAYSSREGSADARPSYSRPRTRSMPASTSFTSPAARWPTGVGQECSVDAEELRHACDRVLGQPPLDLDGLVRPAVPQPGHNAHRRFRDPHRTALTTGAPRRRLHGVPRRDATATCGSVGVHQLVDWCTPTWIVAPSRSAAPTGRRRSRRALLP